MNYSEKNKNVALIIGLLLINVIVIYLIVFIFFYLSYSEKIIEIYISFEYFYYFILLTIVVLIRIIVSFYLSFFFLKKWVSQKLKHYIGFPFLFGLFFYLNTIIKFLDIVVYIMYVNNEFFSNTVLLIIFKIRHIIGTISSLMLLLIGAYLFFFKRNLNIESIKREKVVRKNIKFVLIIWIVVYIFLIIFSPNVFFLLTIYVIFSIVLCLIIWIFITAYKKKILSEINCLIIGIGFTFYLIFHILPTVLIFTLLGTSIYGLLIATIIGEIGILISFIIILIGFKTKAKY